MEHVTTEVPSGPLPGQLWSMLCFDRFDPEYTRGFFPLGRVVASYLVVAVPVPGADKHSAVTLLAVDSDGAKAMLQTCQLSVFSSSGIEEVARGLYWRPKDVDGFYGSAMVMTARLRPHLPGDASDISKAG